MTPPLPYLLPPPADSGLSERRSFFLVLPDEAEIPYECHVHVKAGVEAKTTTTG